MKTIISQATLDMHKEICAVARQSKYTSAFSNQIFSSKECYEQGRIWVARCNKIIVGFYCIRRRKRDGVTVLYFLGVSKELQQKGVGSLLFKHLYNRHETVQFNVIKDNPAVLFYKKHGCTTVSTEAYAGTAYVMQKKNPSS